MVLALMWPLSEVYPSLIHWEVKVLSNLKLPFIGMSKLPILFQWYSGMPYYLYYLV